MILRDGARTSRESAATREVTRAAGNSSVRGILAYFITRSPANDSGLGANANPVVFAAGNCTGVRAPTYFVKLATTNTADDICRDPVLHTASNGGVPAILHNIARSTANSAAQGSNNVVGPTAGNRIDAPIEIERFAF